MKQLVESEVAEGEWVGLGASPLSSIIFLSAFWTRESVLLRTLSLNALDHLQ